MLYMHKHTQEKSSTFLGPGVFSASGKTADDVQNREFLDYQTRLTQTNTDGNVTVHPDNRSDIEFDFIISFPAHCLCQKHVL